jgi:hypothetical protein
MRHVHHLALFAATLMLTTGCGETTESMSPGDDAELQSSSDATAEVTADVSGEVDAGPAADVQAPELTPGQVIRQKYDALFEEVETFLHDPELCVDGHWQLHYGDGQMYGPSFDLKQWRVTGEEAHKDRALEVLEVNRQSVVVATDDLLGAMDELETLAMSLLSLVECGLYLDDATAYREAADGLIEPLDDLAMGLGDYLAIDAGEFAATTYGPTALTAFLALLHFEHVIAYPDHNASHHIARGEAVLEAVYSTAWDAEMATFAFAPGNTKRYLYPSITMMLAYARGYALTGDPLHLARFWQAYDGIQPLKDPAGDHYYSPYSADSMGATDADYTTLSSQNYLMLALLAAYEATGDEALLDEVDLNLGFIADNLVSEGRILHHWMNGMMAQPEDPYDYCLGCNVQSLYILLLVGDADYTMPPEHD